MAGDGQRPRQDFPEDRAEISTATGCDKQWQDRKTGSSNWINLEQIPFIIPCRNPVGIYLSSSRQEKWRKKCLVSHCTGLRITCLSSRGLNSRTGRTWVKLSTARPSTCTERQALNHRWKCQEERVASGYSLVSSHLVPTTCYWTWSILNVLVHNL